MGFVSTFLRTASAVIILTSGACAVDSKSTDGFGGSGSSTATAGTAVTDSATAGTAASGSASGASGGAACGNGTLDGGEQCDGANLNGATCTTLGEGMGTLSCDPVTCTYDTSMCDGGTSSSTGG